MIYFIVTTSLFIDCPIRRKQYITGITKLLDSIKDRNIHNFKVIIVENNGSRHTFLNDLGCDVYYTANNRFPISNKGYKELKDILDCIQHYSIQDDDFIIKMTGRYILEDDSEFMNIITDNLQYDCIIKYGSYFKPVCHKMDDCITGLIGMRCEYVKQIKLPIQSECVEWNWAKVTKLIDNSKIYMVDKLGINICPGSNTYFLV